MIIKINWITFQTNFLNVERIYVIENETDWEFYTSNNSFVVKCVVEKSENQEENMIFLERYLSGRSNIILAEEVGDEVYNEEYSEPSPTISDEATMGSENVEVKHKYLRRTGSSGNYQYEYPGDKKERKKKQGLGDCYQCAANKMIDKLFDGEEEGWKLVHGTVVGQGAIKGISHGHSWLEKDGIVYDYSNNREIVINKEKYYAIGQITDTKEYTAEEVRKNLIKYGTYGPWEENK